MVGWVMYVALVLWWLADDGGIRSVLLRLVRLGWLTAVAFVVAYAFYRRSGLIDAGIEVDATYTFIGLGWFLSMNNPITFAGHSVSFGQMPMQLFGHLPGYVIGFDRLGPLAIHLAIMLQLALLLGLLTMFVVERPLMAQTAIVTLLAGVFCNRLTLLLMNLTGYAVPSVVVGIIFLTTLLGDHVSFATMSRRVGGLLTLAILHHYPGFFFVLPLVALYVVASRHPVERMATFIGANLPLWTVLGMAAITVAIAPIMLVPRLLAVTVPTLAWDDFVSKLRADWMILSGPFPGQFVKAFFWETPGSWHLLNIPPLGGGIAAILLANWITTALVLGRRAGAFALRLLVLGGCLLLLTGLQHLLTGFEHYRDMVLVMGLWTSSIGFVLLLPRLQGTLRLLVFGYAVAVAAYGYGEVIHLVARRYGLPEYAPAQQATMESVRRFWRDGGDQRLRGATMYVAADPPFPLERLYEEAARAHGIAALKFDRVDTFCNDASRIVLGALNQTCERVAFVVPPSACDGELQRIGWNPPARAGGASIHLFDSTCADPVPASERKAERIDLF